eukprot:303709-Hanusia_phi.AAC.1
MAMASRGVATIPAVQAGKDRLVDEIQPVQGTPSCWKKTSPHLRKEKSSRVRSTSGSTWDAIRL